MSRQITSADKVPLPDEGRRRVIVTNVMPVLDGGRFAIKRTSGDTVRVEADIFADGHDRLAAIVRYRPSREGPAPPIAPDEAPRHAAGVGAAGDGNGEPWQEAPLALVDNDRWAGTFTVDRPGWYAFVIEAWVDQFASWRDALDKRLTAGQDVAPELLEGAGLVKAAAARAAFGVDRQWLLDAGVALAASTPVGERTRLALSPDLALHMTGAPDRRLSTVSVPACWVKVDRVRARTGAWYEMFPRSTGPDPSRSATFAEAAATLPRIAAMGFDVLYLPPIHPVGRAFRKGRGNALAAAPGDPGSPWAIGGPEGGHTAIEPGLGTVEDFERFRAEAERLGLEIALDLAYQCSPDHPYTTAHPEWFRRRPDGSIRYAENPPKKYQDIYPFDFETDEWRALWHELRDIVLTWMERGVRIFRVDNPHTKPLPFWEWLIADIHRRDPGVIFLAEAFTRPKMMKELARLGFTQSYTYFTWRNHKAEIEDYFTELTATEMREYYRPNLFTNTPDILTAYLQQGGPAAFRIRAVLAATLGATYGIYSGFEIAEGRGVSGTEEYLDSEKYQFRAWDWTTPGSLVPLITRLNEIRRSHPAFQHNEGLRFHLTTNDTIIAYSKTAPGSRDRLLVVVSLDPASARDGWICVSLADDVVADTERFAAEDLLSGERFDWTGPWNYVRLDPGGTPAHVLRIERARQP